MYQRVCILFTFICRPTLVFIGVFIGASTPARVVHAMQLPDFQLIGLRAQSEHLSSEVWEGRFVSLNGQSYNVSHLFKPSNPLFSASTTLAINPEARVTLLIPVSIDAGYQSQLFNTEASVSFGFGSSISTGRQALITLQVHDLLVAGGKVHERPCRDKFRRHFHCGTGKAWTDYKRSTTLKQRNRLHRPKLQLNYVHKFSF